MMVPDAYVRVTARRSTRLREIFPPCSSTVAKSPNHSRKLDQYRWVTWPSTICPRCACQALRTARRTPRSGLPAQLMTFPPCQRPARRQAGQGFGANGRKARFRGPLPDSTRRESPMSDLAWRQQLMNQWVALFDYRPTAQTDQLFESEATRECRTASRVVRSLREFASPNSKSIQPSLKPSIIRIRGIGFFMPCERNSVSH
jgi:hypothetical protein